ncbi:spermidine/putrescine transport system permease protein [Mycobacterium frederiksbergense]|uniref:Spermidine/putrescine transport system permease protein n=1 Tax=Mycolicibacterium frederiksbergense TaxID=117567 RepID=A0ABT6L4K1_9MYCO|nr:ABC transporter permease [Mycolicibacterium frederiksbergense]MDH6197872.1 spermidine/putrescine transport system permease protein [Mycolicibacterium frederiksbergense]
MIKLSAGTKSNAALSFPLWAYLVFFFLIPTTLIGWYSFGYKPDIYTARSNDQISFDRYIEATDATFLTTFWNTLRIAGLGTLICLAIGLPFAYWLAVKVAPRWRAMLLALVLIPFWTNFLVRTLGWQIMLSPEGFVSGVLNKIGLIDGPLSILYTPTAVQIGVVYNYLPLMIMPLYVALERSEASMREASKDLGAGRLRTFLDVTVPSALPGIAAGCLLVFIPLMGDYITASVLGGAQGNMVGQLVAAQFNIAQNWALGSAMAITLMGFILATVIAVGGVALVVKTLIKRSRRVTIPEGAQA